MKLRRAWIVAAGIALAGCATNPLVEEARRHAEEGRTEEALVRYEQASRAQPTNPEIRNALVRTRDLAVARLFGEAEYARSSGQFDQAEASLKRLLGLDPANARARNALAALAQERGHAALIVQAEKEFARGDLTAAEAILQQVFATHPGQREARSLQRRITERRAIERPIEGARLGPAFQKPVNLEFRDANLRAVFELLSKTAGINFVFDKDVRPDTRVTIFVRNTAIDDIISLILTTNQLARKVLGPNALLIYPNTPAKAREYQELVTRTFYLGNADAKQTLNMIRTIVKTKDVYIDEKLGLVVMRDTPEAVRMAEKLVALQDVAEPEVMLEVEVLEVSRNKAAELGLKFPDQVRFGPLGVTGTTGGTTTTTTASEFVFAGSALDARVSNPAFILNLKQQEGATNTLANPRIRVRSKEKAKIHIGDKVPVITSTVTANVGTTGSVSYLDVGLKLEVEPTVHLDDDIAIKVGLEVSNIANTITTNNVVAYQLGTRNASTVLRLRDGETQVLAGLIQDDDRRTTTKVPGLGELPLLGRLFTNTAETLDKKEIVLLITPRVVRNIVRPEAIAASFASGTEARAGQAPMNIGAGTVRLETTQGAGPVVAGKPVARPFPSTGATSGVTPTVGVVLGAPTQTPAGREISVAIAIPPNANARRLEADLSYDQAVLELIAPPPPIPPEQVSVIVIPRGAGTVTVRAESTTDTGAMTPATLRFRVIGKPPTQTQLRLSSVSVIDRNGNDVNAVLPGPHTIGITQQ